MNGLVQNWLSKFSISNENISDTKGKTCIVGTIGQTLDSYESISLNNIKKLIIFSTYLIVFTFLTFISELIYRYLNCSPER